MADLVVFNIQRTGVEGFQVRGVILGEKMGVSVLFSLFNS